MSEMKIPKDLLWLYGKAAWCNAVISYVSPKHAPGVGVIQPNLVVLIERIASLEAARDERAEQVWRFEKVVEILAADNVALKEKCARLEDALEKQNKYMRCQEGSEEYPSEGCECEACNIQRLVDAALSRANQPAPEEQP